MCRDRANGRSRAISTIVTPLLLAFLSLEQLAAQELGCPNSPGSRRLSGLVQNQWSHGPVANARVQVAGTRCETSTNSRGEWLLPRAPVSSLVLQGTFLGYQTLRQSIPGSTLDSAGILLELTPFGGPDSVMTEPLPATDLRPVLEAVINYFGPSSAGVASHLGIAGVLAEGPTPSPLPTTPLIVLDTTRGSAWREIPASWIAEWRASGRIVNVCKNEDDLDCQQLEFAAYVNLRALPRRTAPDTAYAEVASAFVSALDCRQRPTVGEARQESVRIVRHEGVWRGETFPGGLWLQGGIYCVPDDAGKH